MKVACDLRVVRPQGFTLEAAFACESEALAIVGPSGSGKSTLLDALAGIARDCGSVLLDGVAQHGRALHERRVGYLTQDALLFPHLDVAANLAYSPRAGNLDEIVQALGLAHLLTRRPRHLSGGERRRVALGRALASRPELLLLDEPFAGQDERTRRDALSLLHAVRRRFRLPLVLVSHVPEEIVGLADWALRLEAGRVVAQGPPTSVLRAGETRVDNHVTARVTGPNSVDVDGVTLALPLPQGAPAQVRLACSAHDVLLARERPGPISARNVFATSVAALQPVGDAVLVELQAPRLRASLTPEAVDELQLAPGTPVYALLKATALVYLGPELS